jgi:hypothetical protein
LSQRVQPALSSNQERTHGTHFAPEIIREKGKSKKGTAKSGTFIRLKRIKCLLLQLNSYTRNIYGKII